MIGQTISHYRISAKLGAGGMGEVYQATDTKLERQVALKFLPQQFSADPDVQSRFEREAKALAALSHPNIITVFEVSEHEGRPFIVMEYAEGQTLKDTIASGGLGICRIIETAIEVSEGLAAAHEKEIVHRDIKSDNIVISLKNRAKVMDFGLATWRGVTQLTKEGSTVGTMAYMSPEQAQGREVDHRTDLWSLGVVLYEMITQHLPFAGDHEAAIAYSIANETPHPLERYSADVPEGLQRVVSKCMAKDRDERYQSAADIVADLRTLRRLGTVSGIPTTQPQRNSKFVATLAVLGVAAVATVAALILRPSTSPVPETTPQRKALAVLPFENMGPTEDEYFADGITDEITSRLAKIDELRVISRTSSMQYKGTDKNIRQIGAELGVDFILEGTIRWDKSGDTDMVRITPQLIQVTDDSHVWADNYERALTQIFAVQASIAERIAGALNIALASGRAVPRPTENLKAYDFYLRGKEYLDDAPSERAILTAIDLFERAVAEDPDFAEAYAEIGIAICEKFWYRGLGTVELREKARVAIDQALAIKPDLASARAALGYFNNWVLEKYDLALDEFNRAIELGLSDGNMIHAIATVQMRQGRWSDAEQSLLAASALDPLSVDILDTHTELCTILRRFDDAVQLNDRALTLAPARSSLYNRRIMLLIKGHGDTARAGASAREAITTLNSIRHIGSDIYGAGFQNRLWRFRFADVSLAQVTASFDRALTHNEFRDELYAIARVYDLRGKSDSARVYYDSLIAVLERDFQTNPGDFHNTANLSLVLTLIGKHDEAIRYGLMAMEEMPTSSCHW